MKRILITGIIGYLFLFVVGTSLMMIIEYFNPVLVKYSYDMSYYMYFIDFALPSGMKFSLWGLLWGAVIGWSIHSNHIKISTENKKYNSIKEHFGIDYPDKE